MYITVDNIKHEVPIYYPIDNRNGDKKVGYFVLTSFTVFIMLKRMKKYTLEMI